MMIMAIPLYAEEADPYSEENLIDITDQGLFDSAGQPLLQWSDEPSASEMPSDEALPPPDDDLAPYQETILSQWGSRAAFQQERLRSLKENLTQERQTFQVLGQKVREIEGALAPFREQIATLKDQIDLFNQNIEATQKQIETAEQRVVQKQLDIKKLMTDLQASKIALQEQQATTLEFIALMYREEERYFDWYGQGTDTFKILLADRSVGESLQGQEYLRLVEQLGRDFFHTLEQRHRDLRDQEDALQKQQRELAFLTASLAAQKEQLNEQRLAKKDLLDKSQGEEQRYQELLEEALRQQAESMIAIQNMKENLGLIESKLSTLDDGELPPPPIEEGQGNFETDTALPSVSLVSPGATLLDWPVNPKRGISAFFRDPTYPKRWGVHQAVDIRVPQGTPVEAPANAYVFEAKDNGMGYNYIILAHKGNMVTLYGHVSQILVKPGQVVKKGEVIALTGGLPGTPGAGLQTTGPHLHLEVFKNGEHINPLDALPFWELPMEYIPEEYLKQL